MLRAAVDEERMYQFQKPSLNSTLSTLEEDMCSAVGRTSFITRISVVK